ncbi:hypothetical protein JL722_11317 [Aureococcus anophagefferens]|nr:hypothetical protein JL722_11317 [Aureococcus anophagefferens]
MSIRIETHVGREETMKWGPPLSTVVPDIGELPTYDGLKHRTFETRDEATRRPPYAVFESKTVRFAPSSGEHGAEFADPEALLRGESKYGAVLAREAPFRASGRGDLIRSNWPQLIRNARLEVTPDVAPPYDPRARKAELRKLKRSRGPRGNRRRAGRPDQTSNFSVTSKSFWLIFERIECSRRVVEAHLKNFASKRSHTLTVKSGRRFDRRAGRGRRIDDAYRGPVNLAVFASEIPRFAGPIVVTPASTFARDNARARAPKKRDVPVPPPPGLWDPGPHNPWRHEGVPGLGELRRSSSFADGTLRDMWGTWRTLDARGWCNSHGRHGKQPGLDHIPGGPAALVKNRYRMHAEFMPECPRFPDDLELLKKMLRKRAAGQQKRAKFPTSKAHISAARRAGASRPRGAAPRPDDETRGRGGVESRDDEPEMDALEALEARVRARSTAQPTPPRTPEPPHRATFAGDSLGAAPAPAAEAPSPSRGPNSRASSRPHTPAEAVPRDIRAY